MQAVLRVAVCAAVIAAVAALPTPALAANWEVTGGPQAGARGSGEGFPVNVRGPDEPAGWDKHTVLIFDGETLKVTGNNYRITDAGGQIVEKGTVSGGPTWSLEQEQETALQEQEEVAAEQEYARLQQEERAKAARAKAAQQKAAQQRIMLGVGVGAMLVMVLGVGIVLVRRRTGTVVEK